MDWTNQALPGAAGRSQPDIAKHFNVSRAAIHKRQRGPASKLGAPKELTEKEQEFLLKIADGKNRMDAVLNAYDCTHRQCKGIRYPEAVSDIIDLGRKGIALWES